MYSDNLVGSIISMGNDVSVGNHVSVDRIVLIHVLHGILCKTL